MERMTLNAQLREDFGKGAARSFRRSGSTPAVIYRKKKSKSLVFNSKEITKFIRLTGGEQVIQCSLLLGCQSFRSGIIWHYVVRRFVSVLSRSARTSLWFSIRYSTTSLR